MIYFNNTNFKVQYQGSIILPKSIFTYKYIVNKNEYTENIFSEIYGKSNDYISECELYKYVIFNNVNGNVILNFKNISMNEFKYKFIGYKFDKSDILMIENNIDISQFITKD